MYTDLIVIKQKFNRKRWAAGLAFIILTCLLFGCGNAEQTPAATSLAVEETEDGTSEITSQEERTTESENTTESPTEVTTEEPVIELQANQVVGIPEYPVSAELREQALEGTAPGFIIGSRAELDAFCQSEIKRLEDGGNSRAEHYIREQTFDVHLATCDEAWFEDQVLVGLYYWSSDIAYEGLFRAEKIELVDGLMTADIVYGRWAGGSTAEMVYLIIMEMDKASLEGVETIRLGTVTEEFLKSE